MDMENSPYYRPADGLDAPDMELVQRLAEHHADPHDAGRIALLNVDIDTYPVQGTYRFDGQRQSTGALEYLASQLEPRFKDIMAAFTAEDAPKLRRLAELLEQGNNVMVAVPHGPLTDIGIALAAMHNGLLTEKKDLQFKSAVIVSLTLQMMGVRFDNETIEASKALGFACDQVYFSVPRSPRVSRSEFARRHDQKIAAHNAAMLQNLRGELKKGGMLLMVAPSGTSDVERADGTCEMAPLTGGTIGLMRSRNMHVQPLAIRLGEGLEPILELCGDPRRVGNDAEAHSIMQAIAAGLNGQTGSSYRYVYRAPA